MLLGGIERELQGVYDCVEGESDRAASGRGGPLQTKMARTKWRPTCAGTQYGPSLRALMAARRRGAQCLVARARVSKLVDEMLIWRGGERALSDVVELDPLVKALTDLRLFVHGIRQCCSTLKN